jgi:hypothetical protein
MQQKTWKLMGRLLMKIFSFIITADGALQYFWSRSAEIADVIGGLYSLPNVSRWVVLYSRLVWVMEAYAFRLTSPVKNSYVIRNPSYGPSPNEITVL